MTWLKKIGTVILKIIGIWTGFSPLVQAVVPSAREYIGEVTKITGVITTVEQMFAKVFGVDAKLGSQKLQAATPYVAQIIQASEFMVGKKIQNETAFEAACAKITSDFADLLNSLGE